MEQLALVPSVTQVDVGDYQTYKIGELFSGAGGMALGAHLAKFENYKFQHVWVNDIDKSACQTFANNLPIDRANVHCCDVRNLDFDSLDKIDGLAFGFPCNDFSVVGERKGISGNYGGLYLAGVKALQVLQPLFFVAENVSGLNSSGKNSDFKIITNALENAGYHIFPSVYKFELYGVPQARHRIIIVGFRKDLNITNFIHPKPHESKPKSSRQALQGIPANVANNELTKQSALVVERLKHIKPGENAFTADLPNHLKLDMKSNAKISQIYRRLKPDQPSYTVTGSGGGGTHLYHWKENRALTNRERARIQSFPDDFVFLGGKESVRKQIGMAVPPQGAKVIFEAILKTMVNKNLDSQC